MATLAAYPDWYKDSFLTRQDITEVAVVREYTAPENTPSWNAAAEGSSPITAYIVGTKLTLVCDSLTELPVQMFFKFLSLEKATGFGFVTKIGARAFLYTPRLEEIDIDPNKLVAIGNDAFRLSSIEDVVDKLDDIGSGINDLVDKIEYVE